MTRRGDWIQTFTGRAFYPLDPRPEDVHSADIAHHLSLLCRFAGACRRFYSVVQHSVLVSHNVPPEHALWGLLHDAAEAYVVDLPRPLKRDLPEYVAAEKKVLQAIANAFELPLPIPDQVKIVDRRILHDERAALLNISRVEWGTEDVPLGIEIVAAGPEEAEAMFLARFAELTSAPLSHVEHCGEGVDG